MADTASVSTTYSNDIEQAKARPTKKSRIARHLRRFWWLYLLAIIIVTLAIVLPIVYVYYPRKAQRDVDASVIHVTSQAVRNPKPDSFDYSNTAILEIGSSYSPDLYSWNGSYYLPDSDTPFLSVTIPDAKANNGTIIDIQQRVEIYNREEFTKNTDIIFSSTNFSIYLRGTGSLKESILPTIDVYYDKKISLAGLNKLNGINVTEFHLLTEILPDGANAAGNVTIPNPSVFTLQMGNVTLDLSVNGTRIGNATLPDFTLTPGNNSYPLHVTSNQSQVLELLQLPAYRCGLLPIDIQGRESTVGGEVIPYFTSSLQAYPLRTTLNLVPTFEEAGLGSLINGTCVTSQ